MAEEAKRPSRLAKALPFLLFLAFAAPLTLALALLDPEGSRLFPSCPFHSWTGLFCAGCGSTRAIHELLNGHLLAALAYNPLTALAAPFALYLCAAWGAYALLERRLPLPPFNGKTALTLAAIMVAFTIARNLPGLSGALLAPHKAAQEEASKPEG